jgi:hypothetical protein
LGPFRPGSGGKLTFYFHVSPQCNLDCILCYAKMFPGQKSGFRAGFWPDSSLGTLKIGPPAGLRPAGGPILRLSRLESGRHSARKPDFRPGNNIAYHRVATSVDLRRDEPLLCPSKDTGFFNEESGRAAHVPYLPQYRCPRNKWPSKPYEFIEFGAMDVPKPHELIWFGDIRGPKPYKFIGF